MTDDTLLIRLTVPIATGESLVVVFAHFCPSLGCPGDAVTQVYVCLGTLVGTDGNVKVLAGDDAEDFNKKCLDGSFDITVHCVQRIMTACKGSDDESTLRNTLDPARMKSAFDAACANSQNYLQQASCVSQYKHRINKCCKSIQKQFLAASDEAYSTDRYMELMCSFLNGITGCTEAPIRRFCDKTTADTVVDFMSGITPVTCQPYRNGATQRTKSYPGLLFAAVVLCVLSALVSRL